MESGNNSGRKATKSSGQNGSDLANASASKVEGTSEPTPTAASAIPTVTVDAAVGATQPKSVNAGIPRINRAKNRIDSLKRRLREARADWFDEQRKVARRAERSRAAQHHAYMNSLPSGSEFGLEALYQIGRLAVENGWKFDEVKQALTEKLKKAP
jgi:hypothetical protein